MFVKGLALLLIGLKIGGMTDWNWFIVLIPIYWILVRGLLVQVLTDQIKAGNPRAIKFYDKWLT